MIAEGLEIAFFSTFPPLILDSLFFWISLREFHLLLKAAVYIGSLFLVCSGRRYGYLFLNTCDTFGFVLAFLLLLLYFQVSWRGSIS